VVSSTPRPHFTPGKDPVPILQEAGWAPGPVWTGGNSRPHRNSLKVSVDFEKEQQSIPGAFHGGESFYVPGRSTCYLWCTKWHWNRSVSQYFCFPLTISFRQSSTLIFISVLLLPNGQPCKAWQHSTDQYSARFRVYADIKMVVRSTFLQI